jgi:peptidoglycan hydrolase-like protein with peptidoglycan-binding domain
MRRGALATLVTALGLGTAAAAVAANPQVAGLQVALQLQGFYAGPIDAVQGPQTRAAVEEFQRGRGLVPDGLAGPRTRAALGKLGRPLYGKRVLHRGLVGWDVAVLQYLLAERGFSPGPPDGRFGKRTVKALVAFQRAQGLEPDGVLGTETGRALCAHPSCAFRPPKPRPKPVEPAPQYLRYLVRPGDTLTAIGERYGLAVATVARVNALDADRILPAGATIRIPFVPACRSAAAHDDVRAVLDRYAEHYGVDRHLVRGLAWMESGYQQDIVSPAGARGVMQVTDETWEYVESVLLGRRVAHDVDGNVRVGVAYLRQLLREFGSDRALAVAAYFQGAKSVREEGILPATRLYVADVLALADRL